MNVKAIRERGARRLRLRPMVGAAMAVIMTFLVTLTVPGGATQTYWRDVSKQPLMSQVDATDDRQPIDGARTIVTRSDSWARVDVLFPTPTPGSYTYPSASTAAPPGTYHPEVTPGSPEVFTLWMFVFQNPELCTDPCNADDLGDTPAQGGVYHLDSAIADGPWVHLRGIAVDGQPSAAFLPMADAATAEIHVAIAPHGAAHDNATDLYAQLNVAVGTPAEWFFGGVHLPQ